MMDLANRRAFFDNYRETVVEPAPSLARYGRRFGCPCCGYPTLRKRSMNEICHLCWWEDDGQDDPGADTVAGGPNARYSLTRARENFARYLVMYEPDNDRRVGGRDSAEELEAKRHVIEALDAMKDTDPTQCEPLWQQVFLGERTLRHLVDIRTGARD
jgi:hypothetical protein